VEVDADVDVVVLVVEVVVLVMEVLVEVVVVDEVTRGSGGRGRRGRFSAVGRRWVRGGFARRHVGRLLVPACLFADLVLAAARLARLGLSHDLLLAVAPALGEGG